ncbi:hypothetical protein [Actinomadura miaoliensis]
MTAPQIMYQYVTKGGAVIDAPAPQGASLKGAAELAAALLEREDTTALIIQTVTGGYATVRVSDIDHIAIEPPYDPPQS